MWAFSVVIGVKNEKEVGKCLSLALVHDLQVLRCSGVLTARSIAPKTVLAMKH